MNEIPGFRRKTQPHHEAEEFDSRISETSTQCSEARPGVGTVVESNTADEKDLHQADFGMAVGVIEAALLSEQKGLASRVEELENLIAKHSGSLNSADSASNTESSSTAKETR